jgi:hypothetical protein
MALVSVVSSSRDRDKAAGTEKADPRLLPTRLQYTHLQLAKDTAEYVHKKGLSHANTALLAVGDKHLDTEVYGRDTNEDANGDYKKWNSRWSIFGISHDD